QVHLGGEEGYTETRKLRCVAWTTVHRAPAAIRVHAARDSIECAGRRGATKAVLERDDRLITNLHGLRSQGADYGSAVTDRDGGCVGRYEAVQGGAPTEADASTPREEAIVREECAVEIELGVFTYVVLLGVIALVDERRSRLALLPDFPRRPRVRVVAIAV